MTSDAPTKDELLAAELMAERELASILREAVERSGLDRQEIARRLGIHKSNVSKVLNSPRNLTVRMAARLLRAAGSRFAFSTIPVMCGKSHADGLEALGVAVLGNRKIKTATIGAANRVSAASSMPDSVTRPPIAV